MKRNEREIRDRVNEITKKIVSGHANSGYIVLSDFDQCLVREHISRQNTDYYSSNYSVDKDKLLFGKSGETQEHIRALVELFIGFEASKIKNNLMKLIDKAVLNPNADSFLQFCGNNGIPVVFVTSGLAWSVEEFCRKYDLSGVYWIGNTFLEESGQISGTSICMGSEEKGMVSKLFVKNFPDFKIITVGHSAGDRYLVEGGTFGYRVNLDSEGSLANFKESYDIESVGLNWKPVLEIIQR